MNKLQRKVLIFVAILIAGMLFYPPYKMQGEIREVCCWYNWIFEAQLYKTVDIAMLLAQWLGVLIVGGIAYLLAKSK